MRSRFLSVAARAACGVFLALIPALIPMVSASRALDESRPPRNAAEFDTMFQQIKNWGRWGADDQLGSANLVTAAKRKQAVSLVKTQRRRPGSRAYCSRR